MIIFNKQTFQFGLNGSKYQKNVFRILVLDFKKTCHAINLVVIIKKIYIYIDTYEKLLFVIIFRKIHFMLEESVQN